MNEFRITQTYPLTHPLPYEVQQRRRVWYLLWPVWRTLREWEVARFAFRPEPMRFPSPDDAKMFINHVVMIKAQEYAEQKLKREQQRQQQLLPCIVENLSVPRASY